MQDACLRAPARPRFRSAATRCAEFGGFVSRPVLQLLLLAALPAHARFADSEVSGPGRSPFLPSLEGLSCLVSGLAESSWAGDAVVRLIPG